MEKIINKFIESWKGGGFTVHSDEELLEWINERNRNIYVNINECLLSECENWYIDRQNIIRHSSGGFFSIASLTRTCSESKLSHPVLLQNEIGYLGIITKEINGVIHLLMQAKIEPGNINKVQISPTLQATRSNFNQLHKGTKPPYLDYFLNSHKYEIVVDQIQSEQSSRFYKKRNRNTVIFINEEIDVHLNHRWMTLAQLKKLLKHDNLVNMDTRTVISCLPFSECFSDENAKYFSDEIFYKSVYSNNVFDHQLYKKINDIKMFDYSETYIAGVDKLEGWSVSEKGIFNNSASFEVIYCNIEIEGRETRFWSQPLFRAKGSALFGLIISEFNGMLKFLVKLMPESGCFDIVELGPAIQKECNEDFNYENPIENLFSKKLTTKEGIMYDVMLSEEGGRFYHEQNRNVIMKVDYFTELPDGYFWLDFGLLNRMIQYNNTVNIQLRNLLSLMEI